MKENLKPQSELSEKWARLADKLDKLQSSKNDGRGVSCVQTVVFYLKRGELREAKTVAELENDKIRSYPDLHRIILEELLVDREYNYLREELK